MIQTRLLPLDRLVSPRRAAMVSLIQTLLSLAIFLALFFAGVVFSLWPAPPYQGETPGSARIGLIVTALLTLILIRLIRRGIPSRLFNDYARAELLLASGRFEEAHAALTRQVDALRANDFADRQRTLLLLDYAEYGYLESALVMLALLEAGRGDSGKARDLLEEAKTLNGNNLLVESLLTDMNETARKARELLASAEA